MKNTFKKVIASIMSLTMLSSISIVGASAAEQNNDDSYTAAIELVDAVTKNLDSTPFYYTHYDYYDSYSVSPTHHYLSAIVPSGTSLASSFSVYLYLNTNILSSSPTSTSKIIISPQYSSYLSLTGITSSTYLPTCTRIVPSFARTGNPILPAALFSYYLEGVENNSVIDSEYDIHCMTSMYSSNPTSSLYTNKGNELKKCIYSLGDPDKDGDLDSDDVAAVQKYVLSLTQADSSRTTEEAAYDRIAFELAADYNQDGVINMFDAIGIAQYVATHNQ